MHNCTQLCTCIIDAPNNVNATTLTSRSVVVTWSPFTSLSNYTGYLISYTTNASYTSGGSVMVHGVSNMSATLIDLEENTLYVITVQGIIDGGMFSSNSSEVSVTTYTDGRCCTL